VGASLTDPNAGLDEDRHSMTEAATTAALEPATAIMVEDAILAGLACSCNWMGACVSLLALRLSESGGVGEDGGVM
jgi:hypothetical protein